MTVEPPNFWNRTRRKLLERICSLGPGEALGVCGPTAAAGYRLAELGYAHRLPQDITGRTLFEPTSKGRRRLAALRT